MPKLIILGTSNAIPHENHENTHMALVGKEKLVLVDCVSNPVVRFGQAGLDVLDLTDLILTHFHPDHVSGTPSLLMTSWLLGRKAPLNIHGLQSTLDRMVSLMEAYDWAHWPNFFPVNFCALPHEELSPVLESDDVCIYSSPVQHLVPTIGLRFTFPDTGKVMAYSCDTQPCDSVHRLALGADVLIHEATGVARGHTSAEQAGEVATRAGAGHLYLIHYRTDSDPYELVPRAKTTFSGPVTLATDFMEIEL